MSGRHGGFRVILVKVLDMAEPCKPALQIQIPANAVASSFASESGIVIIS